MDYVYVTKENIEQEHICCAISSNSDVQVRQRKTGCVIVLVWACLY